MPTTRAAAKTVAVVQEDSDGGKEKVLDKTKGEEVVWSGYAGAFGLLADVISGFIAWVLMVQLPLVVFFYPCVKMGYTGWEAMLILYYAPVLLCFGPFAAQIRKYSGAGSKFHGILRMLALVGVAQFHLHEDPHFVLKFFLGAVGLSFELVACSSLWISATPARRERSLYGYALGLIVYVLSTLAGLSMQPALLYLVPNMIAVMLGAIASAWHVYENATAGPAIALPRINGPYAITPEKSAGAHWFRASCGLGGLISVSHIYLTGHGLLPRYTQQEPFPSGLLVILALFCGVALMRMESLIRSRLWFFFGFISALVFIGGQNQNPDLPWSFLLPPWLEFMGSLGFAVYASSIWLPVGERIVAVGHYRQIGFTLAGVWGVYHLANMWAVYVVAFKFMDPVFGVILRERHQSLCIGLVVLLGLGSVGDAKSGMKDFIGQLTGRIATPSRSKNRLPPGAVIGLLFVLFWGFLFPATVYRLQLAQTPSYQVAELPTHPNIGVQRNMVAGRADIPTDIRGLAWAIHFGYNNFGGNSAPEMVRVLRETRANVIGLVETDDARTFLGQRDFTEYLGTTLGFHTDYGPSTAQNTWGCALLSLFPIIRSERVVLPSPQGELACLIDADILVNGTAVHVLVAHVGNTEDELDRQLQHEVLSRIVRRKRGNFSPTLLLSYLTTDVWANYYVNLIQGGLWDTTNALDRYCLYVLYRDMDFLGFERVDKGDVSDTEAQVGTFRLLSGDQSDSLRELPNDSDVVAYCRSFHNDTVSCQARRAVCGWCQLHSWGACVEPSHSAACTALAGVWVGPESETQNPHQQQAFSKDPLQAARAFAEISSSLSTEGLHPLKSHSDGKFSWTVTDIRTLEYKFERHAYFSAPFEFEEAIYQIFYNLVDVERDAPEEAAEEALKAESDDHDNRRVDICILSVSEEAGVSRTIPTYHLEAFVDAPRVEHPGQSKEFDTLKKVDGSQKIDDSKKIDTHQFKHEHPDFCIPVGSFESVLEVSDRNPRLQTTFVVTFVK